MTGAGESQKKRLLTKHVILKSNGCKKYRNRSVFGPALLLFSEASEESHLTDGAALDQHDT